MHFLFDAQMPVKLVNGLSELDQENRHGLVNIQFSHADLIVGQGATDAEVILKAATLDNAIIISEDDDFKRIKANKELIKKHNLGYVLYKPPKHGSRYWEKVVSFILVWEDLKKKIKSTRRPFIFKIDKTGNIHEETF